MSLNVSLTPSRKVGLEEKIRDGMSSLRAGHTIPAEEVWAKLGKVVVTAEKRRVGRPK